MWGIQVVFSREISVTYHVSFIFGVVSQHTHPLWESIHLSNSLQTSSLRRLWDEVTATFRCRKPWQRRLKPVKKTIIAATVWWLFPCLWDSFPQEQKFKANARILIQVGNFHLSSSLLFNANLKNCPAFFLLNWQRMLEGWVKLSLYLDPEVHTHLLTHSRRHQSSSGRCPEIDVVCSHWNVGFGYGEAWI